MTVILLIISISLKRYTQPNVKAEGWVLGGWVVEGWVVGGWSKGGWKNVLKFARPTNPNDLNNLNNLNKLQKVGKPKFQFSVFSVRRCRKPKIEN